MSGKKSYSPLRYPGGKSCLSNFITEITEQNNLIGGSYLELYAGGAGAALNMLFDEVFNHIHINDYDYNIYCIWHSILYDTDRFIQMVIDTPITIQEWHRQRDIFNQGNEVPSLLLGFATFFLNRTNRSGIIFKAGPIGGLTQEGNYGIDVRFNKENLVKRIIDIADRADQITLTNLDALTIIENLDIHFQNQEQLFIYLDPPYYKKGKQLYMNNYDHDNHLRLAESINLHLNRIKWLVSYDNVDEIKAMYEGYRKSCFDLNYTLQSKKFGSELLVYAPVLELPASISVNSRENDLILL